jgi:hypothetical protein
MSRTGKSSKATVVQMPANERDGRALTNARKA